jgi:hypothetical protein
MADPVCGFAGLGLRLAAFEGKPKGALSKTKPGTSMISMKGFSRLEAGQARGGAPSKTKPETSMISMEGFTPRQTGDD